FRDDPITISRFRRGIAHQTHAHLHNDLASLARHDREARQHQVLNYFTMIRIVRRILYPAFFPRCAAGPPWDNSSGEKITIVGVIDEGGLRACWTSGVIGQGPT